LEGVVIQLKVHREILVERLVVAPERVSAPTPCDSPKKVVSPANNIIIRYFHIYSRNRAKKKINS
jgi:hypothetical protein